MGAFLRIIMYVAIYRKVVTFRERYMKMSACTCRYISTPGVGLGGGCVQSRTKLKV